MATGLRVVISNVRETCSRVRERGFREAESSFMFS